MLSLCYLCNGVVVMEEEEEEEEATTTHYNTCTPI
jgi:hypothetical protein